MTLQIKELIQKHDWFFDYSDDQRDWRKGSAEKQEILSLMRKIPRNQTPELLELVPQELKEKWFLELQKVAVPEPPNNNTHPPQEDESW
jgi:hypothetical protein